MHNIFILKIGNWGVYSNESKTELMFTNELISVYAYYDSKKQVFYFDKLAPKTVTKKALVWAKNNMKSVYYD